MGYTRYWKTNKGKIGKETLKKIQLATEIAEKKYGIVTEKVITETKISINGDKSKNLDFETFFVEENQGRSYCFCKTGERPYDVVVNVILKILAKDNKVYDVQSDGDSQEELASKLFDEVIAQFGTINN